MHFFFSFAPTPSFLQRVDKNYRANAVLLKFVPTIFFQKGTALSLFQYRDLSVIDWENATNVEDMIQIMDSIITL